MESISLESAFQTILSASKEELVSRRTQAILVCDKLRQTVTLGSQQDANSLIRLPRQTKPAVYTSLSSTAARSTLPVNFTPSPRNPSVIDDTCVSSSPGSPQQFPEISETPAVYQVSEFLKHVKKEFRHLRTLLALSVTDAIEPPILSKACDFRIRDLETQVKSLPLRFRQALARRSLALEYCCYAKNRFQIDVLRKLIVDHDHAKSGHLKTFLTDKSFSVGMYDAIRIGIKMLILENLCNDNVVALSTVFSSSSLRRVPYANLTETGQGLQGMLDAPWNASDCRQWFQACCLAYDNGTNIIDKQRGLKRQHRADNSVHSGRPHKRNKTTGQERTTIENHINIDQPRVNQGNCDVLPICQEWVSQDSSGQSSINDTIRESTDCHNLVSGIHPQSSIVPSDIVNTHADQDIHSEILGPLHTPLDEAWSENMVHDFDLWDGQSAFATSITESIHVDLIG